MKIETEKQKQKSAQDTNAMKPDDDDTTSRASAGERSQGTRKRKVIAEANAAKVEVTSSERPSIFWRPIWVRERESMPLRIVHVPHVLKIRR